MKWLFIAAAFLLSAGAATAQDLSSCHEERVAGRTVLACPDGLYEWLRVNNRSVLSRIDVVTGDEADMLREREAVRRHQRQYSPRFGGYGYGYSSQGYQCIGNVSTIRDYYTEYCRNERRQYELLRRNQHNPCLGRNAHRYADVCARWRSGTYGRGY